MYAGGEARPTKGCTEVKVGATKQDQATPPPSNHHQLTRQLLPEQPLELVLPARCIVLG